MDRLVNFTSALNWNLLFDLNQFYRTEDWIWDPSNAEAIFDYTTKKYPNANIIWQVGNGNYDKISFLIHSLRNCNE